MVSKCHIASRASSRARSAPRDNVGVGSSNLLRSTIPTAKRVGMVEIINTVSFYVYILESLRTGRYYIGQTDALIVRFRQHQDGLSSSTKAYLVNDNYSSS